MEKDKDDTDAASEQHDPEEEDTASGGAPERP